jgi:quinol monooxygenase YgiN
MLRAGKARSWYFWDKLVAKDMSLTRMVRMHFLPEGVESFLVIWRESRSHIRMQPGCLEVRLFVDPTDATVYYTLSRWASLGDLNAYRHSELFGRVWPRTKALFASAATTFSLAPVLDGAE